MKKTLTKAISLLMSAVMTISALSLANFSSFAETDSSTEQTIDTEKKDVQLEGFFGTMLSDEINDSAARNDETKNPDYTVYRISHEYHSPYLGIEYYAAADCTLFVGFYNDEGTELLSSQTYALKKSENGFEEFIINEVLPDSYLIKAFIIGNDLQNPLSPACKFDKCTRRMQEILAKTTDDYDAENVINLNDDDTTNFLVAKDDVIIISSSDEKDTYIKNDNSGKYEFKNADKIKELKKGNKVLITISNDILSFEVTDISINGDSVIITPKILEPKYTLDLVKFDASKLDCPDMDELETTENEDVVYRGSNIVDPEENTPSDPSVLKLPHTKSLKDLKNRTHKSHSITFDVKNKDFDIGKNNLSFAGQVTLYMNFDVEVYYESNEDDNDDDDYTSFFSTMEIGLQLSFNSEFKRTIKIPECGFGVGLRITIQPEIVISLSGKLNWKTSKVFDITHDIDGKVKLEPRKGEITNPFDPEYEIEFSVSLRLKVGVKLLFEKLLSTHIIPEFGVKITLTNAESNLPQNVRHDCKNCVSLIITPFFRLSADLIILGKECEATFVEIGSDVAEFHKADGSGWQKGPCSNMSHLITMRVIEKKKDDGKSIPIKGAMVYYNGKAITDPDAETEIPLKSDENGIIEFYEKDKKLLNKSYCVTVQTEDGTKFAVCPIGQKYVDSIFNANKFEVELDNQPPLLKMKTQENDDKRGVCGTQKFGENDIIATAWYHVYDNGDCYITGTGYVNSLGSVPKTVKNIFFVNSTLKISEDSTKPSDHANFNNITNVEYIDLHNISIGYLPNGAFQRCYKLKKIELPHGMSTIGSEAFKECSALEHIDLHDSVGIIEKEAFSLSGLKEFNCPVGLKTIQYGAFSCCKNLKEVKFNPNLEYIEADAFAGTGLQSINIPASVTRIDGSAFGSCYDLNSVIINNDYDTFNSTGTRGATIFSSCTNIKKAIFNEGVTRINYETFACSPKLSYVSLPGTLKTIEERAFEGTSLTSIKLPEGLETISVNAFQGTNLTNVSIPESVTYIGSYAFDKSDSKPYYVKSIRINNPDCEIGTSIIPEGKDVIVYGHDGSTAEAFAKENNNTFVSLDKKPTTTTTVTTQTTTTTTTTTAATTVVSAKIRRNNECVFIAVEDAETANAEADKLLAAENVGFFDQQKSDEEGVVSFFFIPKALTDWTYIFIEQVNHSRIYKTVVTPDGKESTTWWYGEDPEVTMFGDSNGDGMVDLADAILIMQALANPNKYDSRFGNSEKKGLDSKGGLNGDVYDPGSGITGDDALAIQEYLIGKIPSLPVYLNK